MYPHFNETMEQYTRIIRHVLDAAAPFSVQWITTQHLKDGFQVAFDKSAVLQEKELLRGELNDAGIHFSMNDHVLNVSFNDDEIEVKLQKLIDKYKQKIIQQRFGVIERDEMFDPGNDESPLQDLMDEIPKNVDGTALDPERTAQALARHSQALNEAAEKLGVGNIYAALTSPRSGRGRVVGDGVSGDD